MLLDENMPLRGCWIRCSDHGDKTIEYEQNMSGRKIAVVSLSVPHWQFVKPHIGRITLAVENATPGSFTRVECGAFSRRGARPQGPSPL